MRLDPANRLRLERFRGHRRGWYSLWFLVALVAASLAAEWLVSDRALAVRYQGEWSFPTYGPVELGARYGLDGEAARMPVDYRELARRFAAAGGEDRVWMPLVPYGPQSTHARDGVLRAAPPDAAAGHLLGTDTAGRDVLARLVYGFRTAILFAAAFTLLTYVLGVGLGCLMGYLGGTFDLLFQRLIEVWSNLPFLYMVIIVFSIIPGAWGVEARILMLLGVMVLFSWMPLTYFMRTETYRESARDYVAAARVMGAGGLRIVLRHILPNTLATALTFVPFTVVAGITYVTALDFLGWGLPPPTPSLGELLRQGTANLTTAPWIAASAFTTLVTVLVLVTFVGEAVREAYSPRRHAVYE